MEEAAGELGVWLASDFPSAIDDKDTVSIYIMAARRMTEVIALVAPLSKKLKNGVSVWAPGITEKTTESPPKIKIRKLETETGYDIVIFAPYGIETVSVKSLRNDVLQALTIVKLSEDSRIVICAPSSSESNPVSLRVRIFGHSPPSTEEIKGPICEDDIYQVLENIGFNHFFTQRLDCRICVEKFLKGLPGGTKELSDWLRVSFETCKRAGSQELSAIRRLCEKGTEDILQPKTVFCFPPPAGFERDGRAQPSMKEWWPNGDFKTFRNYGSERWNEMRRNWERDGTTSETRSETQRRVVTKVPKLSPRDLNTLVENLTTNHDRLELPNPMRLDDLLDVLVDVWDSLDDGA